MHLSTDLPTMPTTGSPTAHLPTAHLPAAHPPTHYPPNCPVPPRAYAAQRLHPRCSAQLLHPAPGTRHPGARCPAHVTLIPVPIPGGRRYAPVCSAGLQCMPTAIEQWKGGHSMNSRNITIYATDTYLHSPSVVNTHRSRWPPAGALWDLHSQYQCK